VNEVFIGNDLDDICLSREVGLSATPANGIDDLKKISDIVSRCEYSLSVSDIIQKVWGLPARGMGICH
jgi:3-deoxy-D-manno-octulosonate 8-phosphate phosphatase KdsC-like HAD superfamily phosphatase